MRRLRSWLERDPGLALVALAMVTAFALYAPTLDRGLVNYDDRWLIENNWIVNDASLSSIDRIFFDLSQGTRYVLGSEYLPIRDLSVMLDHAVWSDHWGGYHFTNVLLFLLSLVLLFKMLDAFGFDRTICGLAIWLFAIHPAHAETVAWLSERKGLLGLVFAATTGLAYARFRTGRSARWMILASVATVAAVWSKAPAAFTIAALGGLELIAPSRRTSWRRSLAGLGTLAVFGGLALVPVVLLATRAQVVGGDSFIPGGKAALAVGLQGFYLRLSSMAMPNALSYPITTLGPSALDLVLGVVGWLAIGAALWPRLRAPAEIRAAAVIWVFTWLPISHLLLPLHQVGVADRYALVLVLGVTLAIATGVRRIGRRNLQIALVGVISVASLVRALDAQASWRSNLLLYERAVESNPYDSQMWAAYVLSLDEAGMSDEAERAIEVGLEYAPSPNLLLRRALRQLARGERDAGIDTMRQAAEGQDPVAMGNYAQLLLDSGKRDDALLWGRRAALRSPTNAHTHRSHGMVALATGHAEEARAAFAVALGLEPSAINRFNTALALLDLDRAAEAIPLLEACVGDPRVGRQATLKLAEARQRIH